MNVDAEYKRIKDILLSDEMNSFMPGTGRIDKCLKLLGNPQNALNAVHVVGTNGKGSTSRMLAGMLIADGKRTGVFTSPYISELTEYILVDNEEISCGDFARHAGFLLDFCSSNNLILSHFEFITVLAVLYFKEQSCDFCIFEAGLGGREDATNIFEKSLLTVITSIGLDHTAFLGNSVASVINNKLGICRPGETVVSTDRLIFKSVHDELKLDNDENAVKDIEKYCKDNKLKLYSAFDGAELSLKIIDCGTVFGFGDLKELKLNTGALYQVKNAVASIAAYTALAEKAYFPVNEKSIRAGIESFSLKARFEKVLDKPGFFIDGGHNEACIKELVNTFKERRIRNITLITGVMADKDYEKMYELLDPFVKRYICIDEFVGRALKTHELAAHLLKYGKPVIKAYTAELALSYLSCDYSEDETIIFAGTLYMSDKVRMAVDKYFCSINTEKEYSTTVDRLVSKNFFSKNYSLDDMKKLLDAFGHPENDPKIIHVAGTNGKGSVCSMLASVFTEAGYKTGLFTSPYLREFGERIRLDQKLIEKNMLVAIITELDKKQKELGLDLNQFALITAAAFIYYSVMNAEMVVLETGLGGTYDPTNIVEKPLCTVIMNIGLDHMSVLGNSIEEIAAAKAGIIKKDVPLVIYPSEKKAVDVIINRAKELNVNYILADADDIKTKEKLKKHDHINSFTYKGIDYDLMLEGDFQCKNAVVAIECAKLVLCNKDKDSIIVRGLKNCRWSGRLQCLSERPLVYIDGGHNPQCIEAVTAFLNREYSGFRKIFIVAFLKDKSYNEMYGILSRSAEKIFAFPLKNPRSLSKMELTNLQKNYIIKGKVADNAAEAYREALKEYDEKSIIVFTGSLYMMDEVYKLFEEE